MNAVELKLKLLTPQQAAEYLGVKTQTLAAWRCNSRYALPTIKVGRSIRYRVSDLEQWLASRTVNAISDQ